jgi:RNA polymerase sigma-70 factor (ECF subfamily)
VLADNPANATETDLVLRCQEGDTISFKQLYRRYQQRVRATLYQLCGSEMLDDLVQEVFLRVWKGLPKLRKASYFSTWLYRITWNVATDKRRKFAQDLSVNDDGSILNIMPSRAEDTPDLMRLHYQDLVQQGLQSLSLEHRAVLVLHDLEDVPQKEVANILNLPVGTIKSRLFYARNKMRKFLKQQGAL